MLHTVSECVQLCQFEGSVTTTVTGGVPSVIVLILVVRGTV